MRNLIIYICAAAILFSSCSREEKERQEQYQIQAVVLSPESTKADAMEGERFIGNTFFYIFDDKGEFVARYQSPVGTFSFYVTEGNYRFYTFVNIEQMIEAPANEAELLSQKISFTQNNPAAFVMHGFQEQYISRDDFVKIRVKRQMCKIMYSVTVGWENEGIINPTFHLEDVRVTNIPGVMDFTGTYQPSSEDVWYNKMGELDPETAAFFYVQDRRDILEYELYESPNVLYAFPNATVKDDRNLEIWSPRFTRLVFRAILDGQEWWYPVSLPDLKPNYCYQVKVEIGNEGGHDAESQVPKYEKIRSQIIVKEWEAGAVFKPEI